MCARWVDIVERGWSIIEPDFTLAILVQLKYESFAKLAGWEQPLKAVKEVYSARGDGKDW